MRLIQLFTFVCLLAAATATKAQNQQINLVGNWSVRSVELNPNVPHEEMTRDANAFKAALEKASFQFSENGECSVRIDAPGLDIPKGAYLYETERPFVRVVRWENRETMKPVPVMLKVWQNDAGETRFSVLESPITFVVEKR